MTAGAPPVAKLSERVTDLEQQRITFVEATVVAVSPIDSTFTVEFSDGQRLAGITAPPHFLPAVGDEVLLERSGALPIYQPGRVAEGAIGELELEAPVREKINVAVDAANGKNRVTYNEDPPSDLDTPGNTVGDLWWQVTPPNPKMTVVGQWLWDGATWTPTAISDAVFTTITAALIVTGRLGAAVEIAVGDPTTVHTLIDGTRGIVIQAPDAAGVQRELNRYGRGQAVIDPVTGDFLASVDSAGRASFTEMQADKVLAGGVDVAEALEELGGRQVGHFGPKFPGSNIGPISGAYGICEAGAVLRKGRVYRIDWRLVWQGNFGDDEAIFRLVWSNGADGNTTTQPGPPPATSTFEIRRFFEQVTVEDRNLAASGTAFFYPTVTSRFRVGLAVQRGTGSSLGTITIVNDIVELTITDEGPAGAVTGGFSSLGGQLAGGGATPPPPPSVSQQYDQTFLPAGRRSWRGSGQEMTWAGNDVYQGYEATNGDTRGQFWFNLPDITGDVDAVTLKLYFRHWHFNSGGTARIGITDQRGVFTSHSFRPIFNKAGFSKPGSLTFFLPSDWWPYFRGTNNNSLNGRATAITLGPGGGTNQTFYGIATQAELRIKWTQ